MALGNWFFFNQWLLNMADGGENITTDTLKAILCGSAQVLDKAFVGASTDARYADITAEKPTASGYTVGGLTLTNKTVLRAANIVTLKTDYWEWNFSVNTAGLKYCVIYDFTSANKDLVMACDLDTDGGTVTAAQGPVRFTPHADGLGRWYQP